MTNLSARKSRLKFITEDCIREQGRLRPVCFEFDSWGNATVRLKGLKTGFQISSAAIYGLAVKLEVARRREEKRSKRRTR